jgi:hypothetical protein
VTTGQRVRGRSGFGGLVAAVVVAAAVAVAVYSVSSTQSQSGEARPTAVASADFQYHVRVEVGYLLQAGYEPGSGSVRNEFTVNLQPHKLNPAGQRVQIGGVYWWLRRGQAGPYNDRPAVKVAIHTKRPDLPVRCFIWINNQVAGQNAGLGETECNA